MSSAIHEICVDLGSFGDMLGNLSPTFGLKANSALPTGVPQQAVQSTLSPDKRKLLGELSELGAMLKDLSPRDVSIWGA